MYNKIKNPISGRFISINSKLGKNIIKKYLSIISGGSSPEEVLLETVEEIIKEYLCPITHELMIDPVMIDSGNTFEREAILKYFENHNKDPETNEVLDNKKLIANKHLKGAINRFVDNFNKKYGGQKGERWDEIKNLVSDFKTNLNRLNIQKQLRQQETALASPHQSTQPASQPISQQVSQPVSQPVRQPTSQVHSNIPHRTEPMATEEYNREGRSNEELTRFLENETPNAQVIQDALRHLASQNRSSYRDASMYLRFIYS